jgi:hypothetical protein
MCAQYAKNMSVVHMQCLCECAPRTLDVCVYVRVKENPAINDIRKHRGDNPIQDSPVKKSAIRLFNENTTPDTVSTETELTLLKFRLD